MDNTNSNNGGGITVLSLLGTAFVVLKLMHIIDWSWWWVTAPLWGITALVIIIIFLCILTDLIKMVFK